MELTTTQYAEQWLVNRHDGDFYGDIKPASILRYVQQVSTAHAYHLGITDEVYARTHTAYVLAKIAMHISRTPHVDETLTLVTEPEQLKHAVNKRITTLYDARGQEMVVVDSRWVLIDVDKRMILRKHPDEIALWHNDVERSLSMRMTKAKADVWESMGTRTAVYSLCDMNGHMNNSRYIDVVCDALPWDWWDHWTLEDLVIYYHKEVPRGEQFALYRAQTAPNQWYFCGVREGKNCFEASLTFRPRQ